LLIRGFAPNSVRPLRWRHCILGTAAVVMLSFPCGAQVTQAVPDTQGSADSSTTTPEATADSLPDAPAPQSSANAADSTGWRATFAFYGWFTGVHGTVGVLGHNAGISVPFSDVFQNLKGVIPVFVEADKGRFVMPIDYLWIKLGEDTGLPFTDISQRSVNFRLTESIFTPKAGLRVLDAEHFKIDALGGIRYWYVSQNLTLEPSGTGFSRSQNWVDGVGGGRFTVPFNEKAAITVSGDAGAGGANLDYQAVGLFTYSFTRHFGAGVGWRYLDVNYRPTSNQFVYDTAMSGALGGVYFTTGGKPPLPPTAACVVEPSELLPWAGPVKAGVTTSNFNPKHSLSYTWTSNGATVAGQGTTATLDTTQMAPGDYTIRASVTDPKEKKNNIATCVAPFTVKQPRAPVLSCSASPTSVKAGEPITVTVSGSSPDLSPIDKRSFSASAGTVTEGETSKGAQVGEFTTVAKLDTTNVAGPLTVNVGVTDVHGLRASCTASAEVVPPPPPPPPPAPLEARLALHSVFFPTALPNEKRPEGGLAESQEQTLTTLATDFKAYLQMKPDAHLTLTGHSDPRGSAQYNQALSERRVNSVEHFLVEQGIPESALATKAVGESQQLSKDEVRDLVEKNPDLDEAAKEKVLSRINEIYLAQNRRVDITLTNTGQQSVQLYPFNAADAATLLSETPQQHAKKPARKKK
jgi:antitoxin (DNA-binding transcriptional repressor) of toxin-antitoxin stability system